MTYLTSLDAGTCFSYLVQEHTCNPLLLRLQKTCRSVSVRSIDAFHSVSALAFLLKHKGWAAVQVSRLFSALLQLVNNGNIVLLRGETPAEPFDLQLASLHRPHDQFDDYRAPSFLQNKV